jgi:hypothetical protein
VTESLSPFPPDDDLPPREVHVLHAQLQRLAQPEAAAVQVRPEQVPHPRELLEQARERTTGSLGLAFARAMSSKPRPPHRIAAKRLTSRLASPVQRSAKGGSDRSLPPPHFATRVSLVSLLPAACSPLPT